MAWVLHGAAAVGLCLLAESHCLARVGGEQAVHCLHRNTPQVTNGFKRNGFPSPSASSAVPQVGNTTAAVCSAAPEGCQVPLNVQIRIQVCHHSLPLPHLLPHQKSSA